MNERWCPFFSPFDNGTVTRSCRINYQGEIASYVYCSSYNNNIGEESWIRLDDIEIIRRTRCCRTTRKLYNNYPQKIELGGKKTWSEIRQSVTITVLADSVTATDWTETPSLGQIKNPPPDIMVLEPNTWYGEYIKYSSENPMAGKAVSFDVSSSFNPDEIASYEWDFGDENTGSGDKVDHIYSQPGEYNVTLTVSKNNGEIAKSSLTLTIKDFQLSKLETIGARIVGFDIGDVDNDNSDEVVNTDPINKRIIVYNDQYNLKYSIPFNESPRAVLISDIDNDGKNEIIVGTATGSGYDSSGYAYIGEVLSNGNFSLEWKSPPYCLKWADEMAVGDLNANGRKELIMGLAGNDDKLVSYEYTSSTYSLIFTENIGSDVDSVFVAEDKLFVGTSCSSDYGMRIYNKYNMDFSDLNDGSTCVSAGDVNGDGKVEIVRAIGSKCEYYSSGLVGKHSHPRPSFTIYDETYTKVFTSTELSVDSVPKHVFVTTGELLPGGGEEIAVGIRSETHEIIDKTRVYRYNGTTYEEVWNDELGDVTNDVYHLKIAGYGDPNSPLESCFQPDDYVPDGTDCMDSDPNIHPTAIEYADGKDNDCDGLIDESFYVDAYKNSTANQWLDTGIDLSIGTELNISAAGTACHGDINYYCFGPNGNYPLGSLIGSLVGKIGNGDIFYIGTNYQKVVDSSGRLYLGYYDSDYYNNTGGFDVAVTILSCVYYYKDHDKDGFGVTGDSRCLDAPDETGEYTALVDGDPNDNVNDDGDINSADAILVLKAAVKMPTIFHTKPKSGLVR